MIIPFIIWAYCDGDYFDAAFLIVLSAATDVIDGFIARKFNMISAIGKALDPIADKLTLLTLIVCACYRSKAVIFLLIIFVIKEFVMGIEGLMIIKLTGTTYSARWYGKVNTAVLYLIMLIHICWAGIPFIFSFALVTVCVAVTLIALMLYTSSNVARIREIKSGKNQAER